MDIIKKISSDILNRLNNITIKGFQEKPQKYIFYLLSIGLPVFCYLNLNISQYY